jgi:resuscitation-promoting factor RpfB
VSIKPSAVAYSAIGGLVLFSGIKGSTLSDTFRAALKGNLNVPGTEANGTGNAGGDIVGNIGAATSTAAENQALAKKIAASLGYSSWTTGQAWDDWISLWNRESGWQDVENPSSGAAGIAQNIKGYSMTYPKGDIAKQITWGINYIAGRYGSPVMAWSHEVANNWY